MKLLLSSLKNCYALISKSKKQIPLYFIVTLIAVGLISFYPSAKASPEVPSIEWITNYNNLQPLSIIQTLDEGYVLAGSGWSSEAATFIKIDSSGDLQWQKNLGTIVSVVQTQDSGYIVFYHNSVTKIDANGDIQSSFSLNVTGARKALPSRDGNYFIIGNSIHFLFMWV